MSGTQLTSTLRANRPPNMKTDILKIRLGLVMACEAQLLRATIELNVGDLIVQHVTNEGKSTRACPSLRLQILKPKIDFMRFQTLRMWVSFLVCNLLLFPFLCLPRRSFRFRLPLTLAPNDPPTALSLSFAISSL